MDDVRELITLPVLTGIQHQVYKDIYNELASVVRIFERNTQYRKVFIIFDKEEMLYNSLLSAVLRWQSEEIRKNDTYNQLEMKVGIDPVSGYFMLEISFYDQSRGALRGNETYVTCYKEEKRIWLK